jgi:dihydroflavonol-4-reductase
MRCFVTGATGFVGGHLCERLRADGHVVYALARSSSDKSVLEKCGATIVEGTVDSINIFARHAQRIDVVFHLAAVTKALTRGEFMRVNARGTGRLLVGLKRGGFAGKIVLLSSLAAGGPAASESRPQREDDPDAPVSDYGSSKLRAEEMLKEHLPAGCSYTILRPGAIYGPREHEMLEVFRFMAKTGLAIQFGAPVAVQMTHVEDVADGLVRAAFTAASEGKTYYLNDTPVWTFPEVVRLVAESLGHPVRLIRLPFFVGRGLAGVLDAAGRVAGKPLSPLGGDKLKEMKARFWAAEAGRFERDLDWKPRWGFPEGLRQTIAWYRENGVL